MLNLSEALTARYEILRQSTTDREFYMNVYHYFYFIENTPQLQAILEESENDYRLKHIEIWKKRPMTEPEADNASEQSIKLERFNLFCIGAFAQGRIYDPIDDYKNSPDLDRDQDPVAVILVRGIDYAHSLKKWSPDNLKTYNKWFEGMRSKYESSMRRFHLMFLDELNKPRTARPEISFDKEKSILQIGDKEVRLTLRSDKPNSHYVLEYIFENGKENPADYVDILKSKFSREDMDNMAMYRACQDINKKVSEQAGLGKFLIIKSGKSGYTQINSDYL